MTLEEVLQQMMNCYYDDVECNQCVTEAINYLDELKHWRENPFLMLKKHCESIKKCDGCDYNDYCNARTIATTPEEWKL